MGLDKNRITTICEIIGFTMITLGIASFSIPVSVIVAGVILVGIGQFAS